MGNVYGGAARGIEAGFNMALNADQAAEAKRHRAFEEARQTKADEQADEMHGLRMDQLRRSLDWSQEDRATADVQARLKEIERQSTAAQAAGGKVDPALAQEHGELTDALARRAQKARGILSPAAQTGGDAPNMAVGAAGATDTPSGVVAQQARDFWSRAATSEVDPLSASGPELRMHLAAATGVKVDELPTVASGARDIQTGLETSNQGLVISGMNKALLGRLRIGVGGESPYGGTITRKEIIGLDPAIDANGTPHPNRFIPRMRVYVDGVSPTGGEMYYDAPMTKNGSTEESDKVVAIDIKRGMDWLGNMGMLAQIAQHPEFAAKLKESDGGKSDAFIDNLRNLTRPKPQFFQGRDASITAVYPDASAETVRAPTTRSLTPLDEARIKEIDARAARLNAEVAGTLPARPKAGASAKGTAGGGGGGGGAPAASAGLTGDAFLKTLSQDDQLKVKALADGTQSLMSFSSRQGPGGAPSERSRLMGLLLRYKADANATDFPTAQRTENAFATGVEGRKVRSFNVAINHLDTLQKYATALDNGDMPLINQVGNYIAQQTGKPAPTNFEAVRDLVADEIVAGIVPGVGALADRKAAADKIRASASPAQFAGAIHAYQELLGGQLTGLEQQYVAGGGKKDFRQTFLSGRARDVASSVAPAPAPAPVSRNTGGSSTPAPAPAGGGGSGGGALPPQAVQALREGQVTTFRNGQRWTLRNGQPMQVQ